MILIDSSVWIDYLSERTSKNDRILEGLIESGNQAVLTGIILQEVLQGIKNERSFQLTKDWLVSFPFLEPGQETYSLAAQIFRKLASKRRVPSTIDFLLAALAIEHRMSLFTLDSDFKFIQEHTRLKLY